MTDPNKIPMATKNIVNENIEKIRAIFPDCITEISENGKTNHAVDFDKLRQELSNSIVEDQKQRYVFSWPEKNEALLLANAPTSKTLRPEISKSLSFETTKNIFIEGDNLDALKCIREAYLGKIKLIYIDPPYNTGKDFVYKDSFKESTKAYSEQSNEIDEDGNRLVTNSSSDGRFHTNWLNMIYPRLKIAKDLLSPDGAIFISIDDNEIHNLRKVCDEIFGESNFAAQIPWQSRASIQNDTDLSINHEYILVYAKHRRSENRRLKETNQNTWHNKDSFVFRPTPLSEENFSNPDNDPRGPWKADPLDAPNIRENLTYPITNPNTGTTYWPPEDRCWRFEKSVFDKYYADNRILFGKDGNSRPQLKVFYEEKKPFGSIENSWFSAERFGTTTAATKALKKLFGNKKYFDTPKPISLLKHLIYLSNASDDDIVLDFFAGSGSTGHAVTEYNIENNTKLKYMLCQIDENLNPKSRAVKDGYQTIADICCDRLRIINSKITDNLITEESIKGFRYFKVAESNYNNVYSTPKNQKQQSLLDFTDNFKQDRNALDLLIQVMLSIGVTLDSKISKTVVNNKEIYNVSDNFLVCCFDEDITETAIKEIALVSPMYAVFRDKCFKNDSVADNLEQIFKTYSPETICKVI